MRVANTPAELLDADFAHFSSSVSLPRIRWRVGLRITLFEVCSAFTQVTACTLAKPSQDGPLHRRLQPLRYLHDCSDCYRLEQKLPGGLRTRWKAAPFHCARESRARGYRSGVGPFCSGGRPITSLVIRPWAPARRLGIGTAGFMTDANRTFGPAQVSPRAASVRIMSHPRDLPSPNLNLKDRS